MTGVIFGHEQAACLHVKKQFLLVKNKPVSVTRQSFSLSLTPAAVLGPIAKIAAAVSDMSITAYTNMGSHFTCAQAPPLSESLSAPLQNKSLPTNSVQQEHKTLDFLSAL